MAMTDSNIFWQRTFPDSQPGTDGVAVFEGRIIGRIMHMTNLPRDPKPWMWSVTDPELAGRPGWADTQAMARLIERWQELRASRSGFHIRRLSPNQTPHNESTTDSSDSFRMGSQTVGEHHRGRGIARTRRRPGGKRTRRLRHYQVFWYLRFGTTKSEKPLNAAQQIIARFGGQTALADEIHTKQSTVQYWTKTGNIPPKWHKPIVEAAVRRAVAISSADFAAAIDAGSSAPIKVPEAKWPGLLPVAGDELPCYVLDDGRRVITRTGALNFLTGGKGGGNLESYLRIAALRDFLPSDLEDQFFDIDIPQVVNKNVQAMSASAFIDICRAYSRARDTGALTTESQVAIAIRSSLLLAAFAKSGIESAIDEVTAYQYERAADAIRTRLQLFLEDEMRPWEKTFPDELWIQFGRLTRWRGPIHERPKYWGKLVMELVYGYLDKDVAEWLKTHAPEPRHGRNYHQWLSGQYGLRKLTEHIWMLIGLASACQDMKELRARMAEKFGREGVQFTLYLPPGRPG